MPNYSYQHVYDSLAAQIQSEIYKVGDFLPPEPELCNQFNVSRTTVRKAIEMLKEEGLITVQQGRGTTVADPKTRVQTLNRITSFSETLKSQGMKPKNKKLSCKTMAADKELAKGLEIEEGEEVIQLKRLVIADGKPLAIMCNYLVARYFPNLGSNNQWVPSLYRHLEDKYALQILSTRDRLKSRLATPAEAKLLDMKPPVSLMVNHRISSDARGPFESMTLLVDGTRYEFSVTGAGRTS